MYVNYLHRLPETKHMNDLIFSLLITLQMHYINLRPLNQGHDSWLNHDCRMDSSLNDHFVERGRRNKSKTWGQTPEMRGNIFLPQELVYYLLLEMV